MSEIKLLPCPFCGGEARLQKMAHKRGYYVICKKCGCKTPYFQHQYSAKEILQGEAISRWNTRKPMERIISRLQEQERQYNSRSIEWERKGNRRETERQYSKACSYHYAIEICKEEGGIE